ncbi:DUF5067 domain-containing protein [Coriobacteriales bacterium OH1046]|nr:DUF5067 domain-containing protein [Coriobacteriales bacterium OH1046]
MKINRQMFIAAVIAGTLVLAGCGSASGSGSKTDADGKADAAQEQQAEQDAAPEPEPEPAAPETDYPTTIDGVRLGKDYNGADVAIVTFTWTNNSDDTTSFAMSVHPKVFQNGIECDSAFMVDDADNDKYTSDVRPGTTVTVEMSYELQDLSDIEVEVTELFSFSDEIIASGTYSLQ